MASSSIIHQATVATVTGPSSSSSNSSSPAAATAAEARHAGMRVLCPGACSPSGRQQQTRQRGAVRMVVSAGNPMKGQGVGPQGTSLASSSPNLLSALLRPTAPAPLCCQAASEQVPATEKVNSILCTKCEGNGAVVCSQCKGDGLNSQDFFGGRFKAGTICWLCRGKKQMLCGNCNGAGFMGGFLNTQDD